jgi:hypothetical protein
MPNDPEPKLCNCTFTTPPGKPAERVPSGNCPIHGSN